MHNPTIVTKVKNAQALVIGAGIAGLLAARVLADYYDQVLIVERDALPEQPEFRPGIPQAHHLHRLWPRGKMIMERLFPGFTSDLFAHGAYSLANTKILHVVPNGKFESMSTDNDLSCSRILLEWEIRQRVQMLPGVSFLTQREVLGLETTPDRTKVTGIRLRRRGQLDKQTNSSG